jgi:uncharacterized membrane-anchored protein
MVASQQIFWRTCAVVLSLFFSLAQICDVANAAQEPPPSDPQALVAEIENLGWQQKPGVYNLSRSKSALILPEGMEIVQDADARRYMFITNGTEFPEAEAVVFSPVFGTTMLEFAKIGYVTDDDWGELDPKVILESLNESVEDSNEERVRNGYGALHVKGWVTAPRYDAERRIAFWAIELQMDTGETIINSSALKLGRYGFMGITLIVEPERFAGSSANLETMLATHAFNQGHSYAEYQEGDQVAALSLAALVASAAGAKVGKGGLLALLAVLFVFLKKSWVVIAVAVGAVLAWLRRQNE